ncbi:hypothetical protein BSKO_04490 [Bryopsis sp. KO-2023]|nr:hypothetical protein BSKO_04490 [Bryopsis sp. KO-2023]
MSAMLTGTGARPGISFKTSVSGPKVVSSVRRSAQRCVRPRVVAQSAAVAEAEVVSTEVAMDCINTIRFLAIDGVNKANSGHPGLPMGCAPMGYLLYNEIMRHNPKNPAYFNRDRFVLSAGHGCMLQYSLMHLTGYDSVKLDDLKSFRQWGSVTPGHPENFETQGIEVTTGPLGQGVANAVGLALAEAHLAARFNKADCDPVVDHYTYCIMGDGCNMEGVSNEAISLAGHWGLGKLICFYDDNKISIDGHTDISFTEDVCARYEALGWHTIHVEDGNLDLDAIRKAVEDAKSVTDKPTLIKVSTLIGYGSPNKANSHDVHGAPLGADETTATRENLKWNYGEFEVPEHVAKVMSAPQERGAALEAAWNASMEAYTAKYPEEAAELKGLLSGELPAGWEDALPTFTPEDGGVATRVHSQTMLNALAPALPGLIGGSADLAPSNLTLMKMFGDFQKDTPGERNVRFGVREHGMGAIVNGMGLHGSGLIPYCATFFIFTDYMRAAMRVSALSQCGAIYVMTHDSIGLGEDGPTHQPVEHLASFRAMPNMNMMRPCGGNETAGCYAVAVKSRKTPSTLALSRQGMPNYPGCTKEGAAKGGYTVVDCEGTPDVIVMGTGSELVLAVEAGEKLAADGSKVRVVSIPCWEIFDKQDDAYKASVLPADVTARVAVEAGASMGWERYIGAKGEFVGHDDFGASAPGPTLYEKFGITTDAVVAAAKKSMAA